MIEKGQHQRRTCPFAEELTSNVLICFLLFIDRETFSSLIRNVAVLLAGARTFIQAYQ